MKLEGTTNFLKKSHEEICTLINSNFYFVGNVYITYHKDNFRLIAKHNGRLLLDRDYPTLRGAKIAFSKLFGHRSWRENVKAQWSDFYDADFPWIKNQKNN